MKSIKTQYTKIFRFLVNSMKLITFSFLNKNYFPLGIYNLDIRCKWLLKETDAIFLCKSNSITKYYNVIVVSDYCN